MGSKKTSNYENFLTTFPRSVNSINVFAEDSENRSKSAATSFSGMPAINALGMLGSGANAIYRNASRRFYDPQISTTAIYLPRELKQKNRWRRWFFDHDEFVGAVLELHAELPHSKAEIMCEDRLIKLQTADCFEHTKFFSKLPVIDLEYLKAGEVFIHTPWNSSKGMWDHIIIHNPDFVEVSSSPFVDEEYVIELVPDDELRAIINSTKPQYQELKRKLPPEIVKRVSSGRNIPLNPEEITHIARRSNPYDIRGTSIIDRLFRLLMYEDKLREAQITIADNFIYPLKLFKLGDPQRGWIPNAEHQKALASMLQQATFDPNFALIYHYALNIDYVTVADKIMKVDHEWSEINNKKAIALGVSQQFMTGETTYASANVGLQTQLARYKAKRDLFDINWINYKFLRIMAEKNEWYRRDKREITGQFRVARRGKELEERLIIPKLVWHKKLMMRDDQAFLTFMNNVYAQGKGPLSAITLLQAMGLELEDELGRKKLQQELEEKIGVYIHPPAGGPVGGITAKFKAWRNKKAIEKNLSKIVESLNNDVDKTLAGSDIDNAIDRKYLSFEEKELREAEESMNTSKWIDSIDEGYWKKALSSDKLPTETVQILCRMNSAEMHKLTPDSIKETSSKLYMQGKFHSYQKTGFVPYTDSTELKDYTDLLLMNEIETWISLCLKDSNTKFSSRLKNIFVTSYYYGQLKGYQEQGIYKVKVSNVPRKDGQVFETKDLLSKGMNLGFLISPSLDISVFLPALEELLAQGETTEVDPQVPFYKSFYLEDVEIIDCPIELVEEVRRTFSALFKLLKKKRFSTIRFVEDVVYLPEWEESVKEKIAIELVETKEDSLRDIIEKSRVQQERIKAQACLPQFFYNNTLFISNWVARQAYSFPQMIIEEIKPLNDLNLQKLVVKAFEAPSYNLTQDEISTYSILGIIESIEDDKNNIVMYSLIDDKNAMIDEKLIKGKLWNKSGECLNKEYKSALDIFKDKLPMWINYPHLLDDKTKKAFQIFR